MGIIYVKEMAPGLRQDGYSEFDVYTMPDEENGPLSEMPPKERQAQYEAATLAWLKIPIAKRMDIEARLRANGVNVDDLNKPPESPDQLNLDPPTA